MVKFNAKDGHAPLCPSYIYIVTLIQHCIIEIIVGTNNYSPLPTGSVAGIQPGHKQRLRFKDAGSNLEL